MWEHRLTPRTEIPGVYLCGAATHPGGSVIALNGRNAAMCVLEDAHHHKAVGQMINFDALQGPAEHPGNPQDGPEQDGPEQA